MVLKIIEKEQALNLRKRGFSYSEILSKVSVAKSTLSLWLRSVGLSKPQEQRLTKKRLEAMRRGWLKVRQQRIERTAAIKKAARQEVYKLVKDPLWLAGIMLYWAEGSKEKAWNVSEKVIFSNMDVEMHKLFLVWVHRYIKTNENQIIYEIYIHDNCNTKKAKLFWAKNLGLDKHQIRVYFKKCNRSPKRYNRNADYNGLLRIRLLKSTDLNRKISGWIEGVTKCLGSKKYI